jgi:multidrug efflux pump subunit AcrA (membrane-fusion protein)
MSDMEVKKRAWVKNVAIIFLAVMLVLTFFSNTIMNRSLPEVQARYTTSGTITARIRGTGVVVANENFNVRIEESRLVRDVHVKVGDKVSRGDLLITLEDSGDGRLDEAKEELRLRELDLEKFLINISLHGDYAEMNRNIQKQRTEISDARKELAAISFNEDAYNRARRDFDRATTAENARAFELASREIDLREIEDEFGTSSTEYDAAAEAVRLAEIALERAQAALREAQGRFTPLQMVKGEWDAANQNVIAQQRILDDLLFALSEQQKRDGVPASLNAIDIDEFNREIDELKEEIDKLQKEENDFLVTSLVSGIVTGRSVEPGERAPPNEDLMVIEVVDRGYTLSIPVTAEQSQRVTIGDFAEVERFWWSNDEVTAVLSSIRNNPENPAISRLLVFSVSGDVESGTNLSLTISQRSENYSVIVPNAAIRSDTNGDFVLVVMSRSSPLGNRYIATRADVNILASDDTNTAVSGALSGWDFVITASTQPVESGMQVRLVDNP